ncbi:MAG TPA: FUN14 domain-containing protein [Phycisphaerales bacterium]|nr:FUN14 domain-containing protein [Phycisphaerales bacterium]HMP36452.1 FUN14 domain-containing protein [Phycisphaerales bacterium]
MTKPRTDPSRRRRTVRGELRRLGVVARVLLVVALFGTAIGTALWIRDARALAHGSESGASTVGAEAANGTAVDEGAPGRGIDPTLATGLAGSTGAPRPSPRPNQPAAGTAGVEPTANAEPAAAPLPLKMGGSFIAAFVVGFLLRSFLRIGLLVAAALGIAIVLLERAGVVGVNWSSLQRGAEEAKGWVDDRGDEVLNFAKRVVPWGVSGAAGLWFGFRRG